MINTNNLSYNINFKGNAYNLVDIFVMPDSFPANLTQLMPNIPIGTPTTGVGTIDKSIFCNDKECKPSPSSTISTQNYVTLARRKNENPAYPYKVYMETNTVKKFNVFTYSVQNQDLRSIYLTPEV